jgi:hypothetical protein
VDLQRMSIVYTNGDMAAVTPIYNYNFSVAGYGAAGGAGGAAAAAMAAAAAAAKAAAGGDAAADAAAAAGDASSAAHGVGAVLGGLFALLRSDSVDGAGGPMSSGWRSLLAWLGLPGLLVAALILAGVDEPREKEQRDAAEKGKKEQQQQQGLLPLPSFSSSSSSGAGAAALALPKEALVVEEPAAATADEAAPTASAGGPLAGVRSLLGLRSLQAVTAAAALNDVGSYALIAWHSTFYERVYHLPASSYAPVLAVVLPLGGVIGGVGGGLLSDWLSARGGARRRRWVTSGASLLAAPLIAASLLAPDPAESFLALLAGFALSEAWRAPSAVMIRQGAPRALGSTASALYLCARNLLGGFGPLAVAKLAEPLGLQHAMLLAPACYLASGALFWVAEGVIAEEQDLKKAAEAEAAALQQQQQQQQAALPAPAPADGPAA